MERLEQWRIGAVEKTGTSEVGKNTQGKYNGSGLVQVCER